MTDFFARRVQSHLSSIRRRRAHLDTIVHRARECRCRANLAIGPHREGKRRQHAPAHATPEIFAPRAPYRRHNILPVHVQLACIALVEPSLRLRAHQVTTAQLLACHRRRAPGSAAQEVGVRPGRRPPRSIVRRPLAPWGTFARLVRLQRLRVLLASTAR